MLITLSLKKSLIVEQLQGNYLNWLSIMDASVFYRFEAINLSAMMESFVQKYFTKL